ncbi:hypothetical protein DV738_g5590, partial [Chaetothyriales sp. CBS 135597]
MASQQDQPKITLHWLEVSRAHRILWLFEELGISYKVDGSLYPFCTPTLDRNLKTYKRLPTKWADPALKNVHPLGKSPVVTIEVPGQVEPLVLAESGAITEYLCDYFGKDTGLVPKRYKDGQEGKIGQETETWLRYRFFMHYAEGSIMPWNVFALILEGVESAPVPFFIKPIVNTIVGRVRSAAVTPQFETHYQFIDSQLKTSPNGGQYLCGPDLTPADILMSFPLEAGHKRSGQGDWFPSISAYLDRLHAREAYQRAVKKVEEIEGSFKTNL